MSLYKKPSGIWFVRYRDENGRQRQKKAGPLKTVAQELERKLLKDRDDLKNFGAVRRESLRFTVGEKLPEFLEHVKGTLAPRTVYRYVCFFRRLSPLMGGRRIDRLDASCYDDLKRSALSDGLMPSSVNLWIKMLETFLHWCQRSGWISSVPKPSFMRTPPSRVRFLSAEEFSRLKKWFESVPPAKSLPVKIALYAGMRRGEITSLKWSDVDFENRFVRIRESKSGRRRDVPVSDALFADLASAKAEAKSEFVVAMPQKSYSRSFFKKIGVDDFRFHDLRHTFASWLAIKGVSIQIISRLLGHATLAMSLKYAHLNDKALSDAVNRLTAP